MTKEVFENGIKINIENNGVKKENIMLFENYAYDLINMIALSNLEEAINAGASIPEKLFKLITINESNCELSFSENEEVHILSLGETLSVNSISIELVGIRFKAEKFDDWKTI